MNILVVGCGRLGSALAEQLDKEGHDVAVVDGQEENLLRLSETFSGVKVTGMPMDQSVLQAAGVENCDAVAVVTPDDNLNITVAQIVKNFFGVGNVVARISDPRRESVFHRFGLRTVCPTNLAADAMNTVLTSPWEPVQMTFETASVTFRVKEVDEQYIGKSLSAVPMEDGWVPFGVIHSNFESELYDHRNDIVLRAGEKLMQAHVSD